MRKICILLFLLFWSAFAFDAPANAAGRKKSAPPPAPSIDLVHLSDLLPKYSRVNALHTDDLSEMKKRKAVRVLIEHADSNYFMADGHFEGFEYSLLKKFENFVNQGLSEGQRNSAVEFIPLPRSELIPALVKGVGDIVGAGMGTGSISSPEIEFTLPYLKNVRHVFVNGPDSPPLEGLPDLSGRRVVVLPAGTEHDTIKSLNHLLVKLGLQPMRMVKADPVAAREDLMELAAAGIIDLTITQAHLVDVWRLMHPTLRFFTPDVPCPEIDLAWVVRRTNPQLKETLDRFVTAHKKGTLFGNIYYRKYFKEADWVKNRLDAANQGRLSKYIPLFKKYGKQYDIDWRLLAAVAYQESRLNPNSRSEKGAVGLMQVLPSTARDRRVDIEDLNSLENNVHAGTKYLAFLRDHYYRNRDIGQVARIRFALAAYNAGPNTIRKCRNLAEKMGYDGNRWFHHCEIAAMDMQIKETVQYVNNVNNYFLAYSLSEKLDVLKQQIRRAPELSGWNEHLTN